MHLAVPVSDGDDKEMGEEILTLGTTASTDAQAVAALQLRGLAERIDGLLAKNDVKLDDYSRAHLADLSARITKVLDADVVLPRP